MTARNGSQDPLELLRRAEDLVPPAGAQERVAALLLAGWAGLGAAPAAASAGVGPLGGATLRQLARRFAAWSLLPLAGGIVIGAGGEAWLTARRAPLPVPAAAVSVTLASSAPSRVAQAEPAQAATPLPNPMSAASVRVPAKPGAAELLAQERAVLDRARQQLSADEPAGAQRYLEQHAQRFPAGRLREEREAMQIIVLVRLGRIEQARAQGAAFKKQYPASLMLSSVNAALAAFVSH